MKQTEQTLLEQMHITELDIQQRKALFEFTEADARILFESRSAMERRVDGVVSEFYRMQTDIPDIARLIGDADTLSRLHSLQRNYINDIFSGIYDLEYVNHRLRIGLVHKRIGVEPKEYLSATRMLKQLLTVALAEACPGEPGQRAVVALDKLLLFDVSLVFDTYIRSMVTEIETSREKVEIYARSMEEKVRERTRELEEMSYTDPLTGLMNVRHLHRILTTMLRACSRRAEPVTLVFMDIDNFKQINDTQGHQAGDDILRIVGKAIRHSARAEDCCVRYAGDEFCILLSRCTESEARETVVDRINTLILESAEGISLSIGIAQTGPDQYVDGDTLIRRADQQMYAAKQARKRLRALVGRPLPHEIEACPG